ncbi:MAG TPA: Arm DNA-binding domain-containing protein, partial [Acetobacteraceae bacterium]|nr:Arm DNA-binding domain-containing protein [Acetobacteraceae bacterium]
MGKLNHLKAKAIVKSGMHGDGDGLYLQVRSPTRRSWIFRWKQQGRPRVMGLGSFPDCGLAEAREHAANARKLLRQGIDPLIHRETKRLESAERPNTFGDVARAFHDAHKAGWRSAKASAQWLTALDQHAKPIMTMAVASVDTAAVMRCIRPMWGTKTITADRIRSRVEVVLNYAATHGWRSGDNPARWRGHISNLLPPSRRVAKVRHHNALPWQLVPAFVADLEAEGGLGALAVKFTL